MSEDFNSNKNVKEIDIGRFDEVRILAGSHNKIIIEKIYGLICVKDLKIVFEGDDWNVRKRLKLSRGK